MKKWIKTLIGVIAAIIILFFSAYMILDKPLPKGVPGPEAEALASQIFKEINKEAWDSTAYVQWTFRDRNHFVWDKKRKLLSVKSGDVLVLMDLNDRQRSLVYQSEELLSGEMARNQTEKAWSNFCNDSFWLNAPSKVFDEGTERSVVSMKDGSKALMVTYTSGGVTPGDSYLWILDENGRPTSYRMWVSILPLGGIEASWEDWVKTDTEAMISTNHKVLFTNVKISNLATGDNYQSLGLNKDPFEELIGL